MLSEATRFVVPKSALTTARDYLVPPGRRGDEAFVLFLGTVDLPLARVDTVVFPAQRPLRRRSGVGVFVEGEELFRISRWAAEHREIVLGQMHTHPGKAYHSETDDSFPLVSLPGSFSIVVPDFARELIDLRRCACYRSGGTGWQQVWPEDLFEVV